MTRPLCSNAGFKRFWFWRYGVLFLLPLAFPASAETFCAVTISLEGSDGQPARQTWINLIGPAGNVEKRELVRGPLARLCDFGFGPHSIVIAPNECHPITISNIYLRLGYPIKLYARRSKCQGEDEHTGCRVFLRVADKHGKKVPSAEISTESHIWPARTDEFGRVETLLAVGERHITVSAERYHSQSIDLKCVEGANLEQEIVLEPESR